ncbi:uracil-DNA glycosylase family protein [Lactococcus termiticola]|nr:uracil-DNA glycosylase family protein [Lactococcus termiticola]
MKDKLKDIFEAIKADEMNQNYSKAGIDPLYAVHPKAKILIIGQAPGQKTQDAGIYWKDKSGDRLRDWLGVTEEDFYKPEQFAILPMDFYFPGKGKSGDLPPRKGFAEKWHPELLELMPEIKFTLLIGNYAQHYYLDIPKTMPSTQVIRNYQDFLPRMLPLPHPSPRNNIWLAKNAWFEVEVIPELRKNVKKWL